MYAVHSTPFSELKRTGRLILAWYDGAWFENKWFKALTVHGKLA